MGRSSPDERRGKGARKTHWELYEAIRRSQGWRAGSIVLHQYHTDSNENSVKINVVYRKNSYENAKLATLDIPRTRAIPIQSCTCVWLSIKPVVASVPLRARKLSRGSAINVNGQRFMQNAYILEMSNVRKRVGINRSWMPADMLPATASE